MDNVLQTITNSVGTQLRGMNSTIEKMKEEGEDRYQQIDERIANMEKKFSMLDEKKSEIKTDGPSKVYEDQNDGKDAATGFHGVSSEQEVDQLSNKKNKDGVSCQTYHTCLHLLERQWWEAQICQVSKYVDNDESERYRDQWMQRKDFITRYWSTSNVAFTRDTAFLSIRFHWTGSQNTYRLMARLW